MIALKTAAPVDDAGVAQRWRWRYPLLVSLMCVVAMCWAAVSSWRYERSDELLRLETIARLKHQQLLDWLEERHVDLRNVQSSPALESWRDAAPADRERLEQRALARLESFRANGRYLAVWLMDAEGRRSLSAGEAPALSPVKAPAQLTDMAVSLPYRDEFGHVGVDFVGLFPGTDGAVRVGLRSDAQAYLYPSVRSWPVPSDSSEAMLMTVGGAPVRMLSPPRFAGPMAEAHPAAAREGLLSTQLARGQLPLGTLVSGQDYRGEAVLGLGQRVEGTDWLLVVKMDQAEVLKQALHPTLEVLLAGLLFIGLTWSVWAWLRQRQQAAEALASRRQQQARLELLDLLEAVLENSTDAIFAKDLAGRYTLMNSAAARFVARPADEVIGLTDAELVEPSLARTFRAQDEAVLSSGQPLSCDMTFPSLEGGTSIWVNKAPLRNSQGEAIGVFGIVRDVTQRKADEDRVRASEERFRILFDQASAALLILEVQTGRLIEANQRARAQFGAAAIGRWRDGQHAEASSDEAVFRAHLERTVAEGPQRFEWLLDCGAGLHIWLDLHLRVIEIEGTTRILASGVDIDDRKRAEAELRKRSLALSQSPASVMITDLKGRIEYVNDTFCRVSGYSVEEVMGQLPSILRSEQTPRSVYASLWRTLRQGEAWMGEFVNRRKDGTLYVDRAAIHPLRQPSGEITHFVAVQQDITEERALQEELVRHRHHLEEIVVKRTAELAQAKQVAEAASLAKSVFVANMSHEIRTPMNAVIGLNHLVERDLARRGAEADRPLLERVRKIDGAARHLLGILNDVLDWSKIEAGKLQLDVAEFDVLALCSNAAALLQHRAFEQGIDLQVDTTGTPARWRGDGLRLGQVVLNLLSNAVKFTQHGKVSLTVRPTAGDAGPVGLRFEVQDTGIGMSEAQCRRLFNAFEQASPEVSRRFGGTGLGLAIAKRLVDLMSGEIGVHSEPGVGSRFWVVVPLVPVAADVQPDRGTPSASQTLVQALRQRGGGDILVAEDGAINREIVLDLLGEAGLQADVAVNGREAVRMAEAKPYELILMDVRMPEMDGLQATQAIRQLPAHAGTPVVALTAQAFDEDRDGALQAGFSDYLSKPVLPEALYAALLRWLGPQRRSASADALLAAPHPGAEAAAPALPEIPGVDWALGLRTLGGKQARLVQLMGRFVTEQGDAVERMRTQLAAGDLEAAVRGAHTLKGTGASLGLVAVSAAAAALEQALKSTPGQGAARVAAVEPLLQALAQALMQVHAPVLRLNAALAPP